RRAHGREDIKGFVARPAESSTEAPRVRPLAQSARRVSRARPADAHRIRRAPQRTRARWTHLSEGRRIPEPSRGRARMSMMVGTGRTNLAGNRRVIAGVAG